MIGQKSRDALIPVMVLIVMVPTMVPVPAMPPIFIRVTIVAVAVVAVVIGPHLLVTRINVNSESVIRFDWMGVRATNPRAVNPNRQNFSYDPFRSLDVNESVFLLL
jgi:hypothetical protein